MGGCVFAEGAGSAVALTNSTLYSCVAGGGGAFGALNSSVVTAVNTNVSYSGAQIFGGGGITKWGAAIRITSVVFTGMQAGLGGGCLYVWRRSGLTMTNSTCQGAYAVDHGAGGGAILVYQSTGVEISGSNFFLCSATLGGGAISVWFSEVAIQNSLFYGNSAKSSSFGGAVQVKGGKGDNYCAAAGALGCSASNVTIAKTLFINNDAGVGGAVYAFSQFANVDMQARIALHSPRDTLR